MDYFEDFVSLFFPDKCNGCDGLLVKGEEYICTFCILNMARTGFHVNRENALYMRFFGRVKLEYALAYLMYSKKGVVHNLLQNLKFNHKKDLGIKLGKLYGLELKNHGFENQFDTIVPVPLHKKRQKQRGYNQSDMISNGLATYIQAEVCENVATRKLYTQAQAKKVGDKRWDNVRDIFEIQEPEKIHRKRVLIVDDVVTTGATMESLANEVLKYRPQNISILAIADADHN